MLQPAEPYAILIHSNILNEQDILTADYVCGTKTSDILLSEIPA